MPKDAATSATWQEGNTTVRGCHRFLQALDAWMEDGVVGAPGSTTDRATWVPRARLSLARHGVSASVSEDQSAATKMLGALERYGLVRARVATPGLLPAQEAWNATAGEITDAGRRAVAAHRAGDAVALRRVLLNAMALRSLPSPLEPYPGAPLNPIGLTASVLLALEAADPNEGFLSALEFSLLVQKSDGSANPRNLADAVLAHRSAKTLSGDRRAFVASSRAVAARSGRRGLKESTPTSYADVAFRYYDATGVLERGRFSSSSGAFGNTGGSGPCLLRIARTPEARNAASLLARRFARPSALGAPLDYLTRLEGGEVEWEADAATAAVVEARPNDRRKALEALDHTLSQIWGHLQDGEGMGFALRRAPAHDEATHALEQALAEAPALGWDRVRDVMISLASARDVELQGVKPSALMEWCVFRALLVLVGPGGLEKPVREARRFQIAADLLPVSHAAGRGADVAMRCRDGLVIAGEATLTSGRRQVAAEAESVRRHVAELGRTVEAKTTFGIFVAPSIGLNTAEWFRSGAHWIDNDRAASDIVPLTIDQLVALADHAATKGGGSPRSLRALLSECLEGRERGEREWLTHIAEAVGLASRCTPGRPGAPQPREPSGPRVSGSATASAQASLLDLIS